MKYSLKKSILSNSDDDKTLTARHHQALCVQVSFVTLALKKHALQPANGNIL